MSRPVYFSTPCLMLVLLAAVNRETIASTQEGIQVAPALEATRIEISERPLIDGDISDGIWARATVIDRFYQVEPVPFVDPAEPTHVRLLYDAENLYVSVHAFDSQPDKLSATIKSRDGSMPRDDFIRVVIDPHRTNRDGYVFEINPLGGRTDGLLQNNTRILINWNALWRGQSQRTTDGWTTEIAIPFRILSFHPGQAQWGFDVSRQVKRKAETSRLVATDSNVATYDMSRAGTLAAPVGLADNLGLDIRLYGIGRYNTDRNIGRSFRQGDVSATTYYKLTPALTGTLTYNPDFSDTPLDARRVNTSRLSLFDAETREFFLQDAAAFEFGGRGFAAYSGHDGRAFSSGFNNGQAFFSRNIGLVNGAPVGVSVGAKLSGEIGPVRAGALSVRTEDTATTRGQTLSVARFSAPVLAESSVGTIFTHGDPTGASNNSVAGTDFQFRNSNIGNGKRLLLDMYFERSFSDVRADDDAYGAALVYPNEPWYFDLYAKQVGEDFMPGLGFVNRTGVREYNSRIVRRTRMRDGSIRWYEFSAINEFTTSLDNVTLSRRHALVGSLQNSAADTFDVIVNRKDENLDRIFTLPSNRIALPPGSYTWYTVNPRIETSAARPLFLTWSFECCDFYDGRAINNELQLNYRPSGTWDFMVRHVLNRIERNGQKVDIHIGAYEMSIQFNPDMQLKLQMQYDNVSERFRGLLRYKWEPRLGTELFASIGEDAFINNSLLDRTYQSQRSTALVRIGHRLQF